jgi:ribosomal protein S27AE
MLGFGTAEPASRVRICPECGMAVANHKDWCSIFRARQAMEGRTEAKQATA